MEEGPKKQQLKNQKKAMLNSLNQTINPILKSLDKDDNALQMPELALRCAQFFHTVSEYCVGYYHSYVRENDSKKTKHIKKAEKDKDGKGGKKAKKKDNHKESSEVQKEGTLQPPKKPLTAYIIYFQDKKPLFVQRFPSLNLSELTKLIAKDWKELSETNKQIYLDRASEDRKRYDQELAVFKAEYGKAVGKSADQIEVKEDENIMAEEEDIQAIIIAEEENQPRVNKMPQEEPDPMEPEEDPAEEEEEEEEDREGEEEVVEAEGDESQSGPNEVEMGSEGQSEEAEESVVQQSSPQPQQ